jgi:hypothetical protein
MRSAEIPLDRYDSDKIANGYLAAYDPVLEPWIDKEITLLEIGIYHGGSLLLWRDYFPRGIIVGIDREPPRDFRTPDRVRVFQGDQADRAFLTRVAAESAPQGFDIIIDDASHIGELTKISFWHLFDRHLKPGGLYVIEDWGTGYWSDWPDGRGLNLEKYEPHRSGRGSIRRLFGEAARRMGLKIPLRGHNHGMVGFVKQLIDEQGAAAATRARLAGPAGRASKFAGLLVTPALVFVRKAEDPQSAGSFGFSRRPDGFRF